MKFITRKTYLKYLDGNIIELLQEEGEEYHLEEQKDTKYRREKLKEIDKKHDKIFKVILGRKREMANFLNQFLELTDSIKEEELVQCSAEFITKQYKGKYADIIYKLKSEPVYFLIEHQSTIHKEMIERIGSYVQEIMRKEKGHGIYPVVVPIVIYTGFQKWNAQTKFSQKQYQSQKYQKYKINLWYNLITVQDYTFEKLLEIGTLFSSMMILEKCKSIEELVEKINEITKIIQNKEDKKILIEIIEKILAPRIGKENSDIIIEKLNEKERFGMSPLTKMLLDLEIEGENTEKVGREKGKKEGKREGKKEGITETIIKTAQKMLQKKMQIQDIEEITGLSKEEIEKLEKCV